MSEKGPYDDIIHLPHPTSSTHPRMPMADRAAQFSPFSALSGHAGAIRETARLTQPRRELDEDAAAELDLALRQLLADLPRRPRAAVTWFQPDPRKQGGQYRTVHARVVGLDRDRRQLVLEDGTRVPLDDLSGLAFL